MKSLIRTFLKLPFYAYLKLHEHKTEEGMSFLKFNRGSKILAVVFSAFDSDNNFRAYNYVKSLSKLGIDFIFLSDPWGFRGSYYLKNNGANDPQTAIQNLVNHQYNGGGYNRLLTLGTSKGGTAALYYGLKNHASDIIIGACQYRIGSYLAEYPEIFSGMTGNEINPADIESLNQIMPDLLVEYCGKKCNIHLVHSMSEPTYKRDIQYLIADLDKYRYNWMEIECGFKSHDEVGKFFIPYASKFIKGLIE